MGIAMIGIIGAWLIAIIVAGGRAVSAHICNPLPTMENGDKRFCDVKQFKTRSISCCNRPQL